MRVVPTVVAGGTLESINPRLLTRAQLEDLVAVFKLAPVDTIRDQASDRDAHGGHDHR